MNEVEAAYLYCESFETYKAKVLDERTYRQVKFLETR